MSRERCCPGFSSVLFALVSVLWVHSPLAGLSPGHLLAAVCVLWGAGTGLCQAHSCGAVVGNEHCVSQVGSADGGSPKNRMAALLPRQIIGLFPRSWALEKRLHAACSWCYLPSTAQSV